MSLGAPRDARRPPPDNDGDIDQALEKLAALVAPLGQEVLDRLARVEVTSEVIARHRARRFEGAARVADLCCGIGGDLLALAGRRDVLAVDRDPLHLRMATLNADAYGVADGVHRRAR
ncbi:MAG: hypothetical protein ACRDQ4_16155 [Pseudonocardiaceae bacterium]